MVIWSQFVIKETHIWLGYITDSGRPTRGVVLGYITNSGSPTRGVVLGYITDSDSPTRGVVPGYVQREHRHVFEMVYN